MGVSMRFHEIAASYSTPDAHPYGVVISIHPSLWSQLGRYVDAFPRDFHLIDKIEPEPDNWVVHIGCASEAARDRFNAEWG